MTRKEIEALARVIKRVRGNSSVNEIPLRAVARQIAREFHLDEPRFLKSCGVPDQVGTSSSP